MFVHNNINKERLSGSYTKKKNRITGFVLKVLLQPITVIIFRQNKTRNKFQIVTSVYKEYYNTTYEKYFLHFLLTI